MKIYLQILIIGILIFSSNCQVQQFTCVLGGGQGTKNGYYDAPEGVTDRTCITSSSGTCKTGFSDRQGQPPKSFPDGILSDDCDECESPNEHLDRIDYISGVKCATTCATGFTDNPIHGGPPTSPYIKSACFFCLSATHTMYFTKCYQHCTSGQYFTKNDGTCGTSCAPGHTDDKNRGPASSPLQKDCIYCLKGTINNDDCDCAISTQFLTSIISEECGTACVSGYTHNSNGNAPAAVSTGHCLYCVSGLVNNNGVCECAKSTQFLTSISGKCGTACVSGYTHNYDGSAPNSPSTGHCLYCLNGLVNRNGVCQCQNEGEYLINSYSGTCGKKCDEGYVQWRDGFHFPVLFTHCLYCHYGLENNNGVCACAIDGQYLTKPGYDICGFQCHTNFTHYSDGSAPNSPITGHCFNCLSTHTYYKRKCSLSCPRGQYYINFNPICGTSCAPGYTDQWYEFPSNPIKGNCDYCLRGLQISDGNRGCTCRVRTQYLTSITSVTCGRNCLSGYTYNSDGRIPDSPSTGHCLYCLAGLVNNNNVCECATDGQYLTSSTSDKCGTTCDFKYTDQSDGSAANIPSTGHCLYCVSRYSMFQGYCYKKCKSGQYFTQSDGACGTSCVNGHTDQSDGSIASSTLKGDCKYCVRGLVVSKEIGIGCQCSTNGQYLTSIISESCGITCDHGYTNKYYGTAPSTPLTGHCLYCVFGTHTMYKGQCQSTCPSGQYYTQFDGTCGTVCAAGYTDQSDGSTPTSPLRGNCQYCLAGLENKNGVCECENPNEFLKDISGGICGTSCFNRYTHNASGRSPQNPSIGHCLYCLNDFTEIYGDCV